PNKVLKISQIHGSITYAHRLTEAKAIKERYSANIAIPSNENENLHEDTKETQDLLDDCFIHPVHDPTAKWKLAKLFVEDLEALLYFYQSENE
ncbi:10723_t:CDS:2, partial [Dentiscutata heterogama]